VPQVRVIDDAEAQLGIMPTAQALALAGQKGLDLIEVAPDATPPVCRIMDWGKYRYQQQRKEAKNKAGAKKIEVKGIRLSFKIGEHDRNTRKTQTERFLKEGHKVKIEIILRGRDRGHRDLAYENIKAFISSLTVPHKIEQETKAQGHVISTILTKG
jgi:translation initiation factor IF-3